MLTEREGLEVLAEDECLALLDTTDLGRIAVTIGAVPAIFPVNFRLIDGQIVFRTGKGTKLHHASESAVVAFEADGVDPATHNGWSVLAVGVAKEEHDHDRAQAALSVLPLPWAPGTRHHVIAIVPEFVSGRRIVPVERPSGRG